MRKRIVIATVLTVCSFVPSALSAPITVTVMPRNSIAQVGSIVTLDIIADIPESVVGWGLDLSVNSTILRLTGATIGPLWFPAGSSDGDDLVGLAFPSGISGTNVVLATLSFDSLTIGVSPVVLDVTPGDLSEGFPLEAGGFAEAQFLEGSVTVSNVPEPRTTSFLAIGVIAMLWLRIMARAARE